MILSRDSLLFPWTMVELSNSHHSVLLASSYNVVKVKVFCQCKCLSTEKAVSSRREQGFEKDGAGPSY